MATESAEVLSSTATDSNTFAAKRRCNRGFGGQPRRRVTAAARNRERQAPIEECHLKSQSGLQLPLMDGVSHVTFHYYLGEHQSQIFYGGLTIESPGTANVYVELGQSIPIDLRENYYEEGLAPLPCLAVPTHIFRRFRVYRITSSASCDLKKLAAGLSTDGASPDESDASCPLTGEKMSLLLPSTTPKSGLSLISLRVYYPVQYMQSANDLHPIPGSRKRAHFPPHGDEVVSYPSLLTMPVSEFASRVLKGVVGSARLSDCSSVLPRTLHLEHVKLDKFDYKADASLLPQNNSSNQFPSFLILPVNMYNRVVSMKRMLLDGHTSPIPPDVGWRVAVPRLDAEKEDTEATLDAPSWDRWTGLEDIMSTPPWIISKILSEGKEADVRMVFVRRQSDDCGDAICPSLRKSIFGPARIRRTRMKGTNRLVMKVKQLVLGFPNASCLKEQKEEDRDVTTSESDRIIAAIPTGPAMGLNFRYVWSRDCRSNPIGRGTIGHVLLVDPENDRSAPSSLNEAGRDGAVATAPPSSSVTNASTDEEDARSVGGRWHQNHKTSEQQHQRPTRSCLPPQRLEVVDRDLEKALQRSLADGRNKHAGLPKQPSPSPQPAATAKRRSRHKRGTTSPTPTPKEELNAYKPGRNAQQQSLQTGVKRTKSEATLQIACDVTTSKPLELSTTPNAGSTWARRLRSNSPSTTSDSAVCSDRRKQSQGCAVNMGQGTHTAAGNERSSPLTPSGGEGHMTAPSSKVKVIKGGGGGGEKRARTGEVGTVIPKLTLAIGENGRVRVKSQYRRAYQRLQLSRAVPATEVKEAESDDPYALPSSPIGGPHEAFSHVSAPWTKERSPSPGPPLLLPEEEVDQRNNDQKGSGPPLDEEQSTPDASNNTRVGNGLSKLPLVLPPPAPVDARGGPYGVRTEHSTTTPFSASATPCSALSPESVLTAPSSLQHITNTGGGATFASTQLLPQPHPGPPASLHMHDSQCAVVGGHGNHPLTKSDPTVHNDAPPLDNALWNGDCSLSRRLTTMWTPRNEPLPPPDPPLVTCAQATPAGGDRGDVGLCFFPSSSSSSSSPAAAGTVSFPSILVPGVIPLQQHQASATAIIGAPATTGGAAASVHQQGFINAAYPMLTSDAAAAAALAMAAVAYFNPPAANCIHSPVLHQAPAPGPSAANAAFPNQASVTASLWNNNVRDSFL